MHIILIDDDVISGFLTERVLRRDGATDTVSFFQSPHEALTHVQQILTESGEVPEVILLDLNMPLMSGWDFLDALKPCEAQLAGRCAIYVLTSSLAPSDKDKAHHYRMVTGVLHKPLDRVKVQAIRAQVAESRS